MPPHPRLEPAGATPAPPPYHECPHCKGRVQMMIRTQTDNREEPWQMRPLIGGGELVPYVDPAPAIAADTNCDGFKEWV